MITAVAEKHLYAFSGLNETLASATFAYINSCSTLLRLSPNRLTCIRGGKWVLRESTGSAMVQVPEAGLK